MTHEHPIVESALIKSLIAPGNAFTIAFLFLIFQYSFKLDFQCPCDAFDSTTFCILYAVFPFFGLWLILTLTTKACTIMCAQCCNSSPHCSSECCGSTACSHIVRNAVLSLLWIVTIFIDGDALVCLELTEGNITHWHDQVPCKKKKNLTAEESQNIRYYQALSQVIGLTVLFSTALIWFLLSMIYQCCKTPYKSLFEDVYEEEAMRCIEMEMRKMIKTKTKLDCKNTLNKIKNDNVDWKEVSKELIALITKENPLQDPAQSGSSSGEQGLHQANQGLHQAKQGLHRSKQALYRAKQALYRAKQALHQANQALHQAKKALHQANQDLPQPYKIPPQPYKIPPQSNQDPPQSNQVPHWLNQNPHLI